MNLFALAGSPEKFIYVQIPCGLSYSFKKKVYKMAEKIVEYIQSGRKLFMHTDGFVYVRKTRGKTATYWECRKNTTCPARATVDNNNILKRGKKNFF